MHIRLFGALILILGVAWCLGRGTFLLWQAPFSLRWLVQVTTSALAVIIATVWLGFMIKILWSANRPITEERLRRNGRDFRDIDAGWFVSGYLAILVLLTLLMGWQLERSVWHLALPTTWAEHFIWSWWLSIGVMGVVAYHQSSYNARLRLRLTAYWERPLELVRPPQASDMLKWHTARCTHQRTPDGRILLTPFADDRDPRGRPRSPLVQ